MGGCLRPAFYSLFCSARSVGSVQAVALKLAMIVPVLPIVPRRVSGCATQRSLEDIVRCSTASRTHALMNRSALRSIRPWTRDAKTIDGRDSNERFACEDVAGMEIVEKVTFART